MDIRWIEGRNTTAEPPLQRQGSGISDHLGGLIVDVRGVLYDTSPWRHWLLQLLHRIGLHTHFDIFYRIWESEYQDDVVSGKRSYWDAMRDYLRTAGLSSSQITEIEAAGRAKRQELSDNVHLFPGVRRTLEKLNARGVCLAVACTVPYPTTQLRARLERLQLHGIFSQIATTNAGATVRSSNACIAEVLDLMELDPSQCAFVGCHPQGLDAAGQAHLHTIALNHPSDAVADVYLGRFDDLLNAVAYASPYQRIAS